MVFDRFCLILRFYAVSSYFSAISLDVSTLIVGAAPGCLSQAHPEGAVPSGAEETCRSAIDGILEEVFRCFRSGFLWRVPLKWHVLHRSR